MWDNQYGQLGDGSFADQSSPVVVGGLTSGIEEVASGGRFGCALRDDGAVECWGDNTRGQLGTGLLLSTSKPTHVIGL